MCIELQENILIAGVLLTLHCTVHLLDSIHAYSHVYYSLKQKLSTQVLLLQLSYLIQDILLT